MELLITTSGWGVAALISVCWYLNFIRSLSAAEPKSLAPSNASDARSSFYQFRANHFETTLSACPDAVIITNDQGQITYANTTSQGMFGHSQAELLNNNVTLLMPDHIAKFHHQYLLDFHLTGKTGTIGRRREIVCKRKNGSTFPAELSLGATKEEGRYVFIGIITDISDRKRAERRHRRAEQLRQVLTNSSDSIMLLFTPDGICRLANPSALASLGKPEDQVIGQHMLQIISDEVAHQRLNCIEQVVTTKDAFTTHDERDNRVFENTYTPIINEEGLVTDIAIHAHNITERYHQQQALESAKDNAEKANESKTLFISKVCHELKNPLHSILGFAHIIREESEQEKPDQTTSTQPEMDDAISTIINSGSHILSLINDLLDLSASDLNALPVKLSEVNLSDLLKETLMMMMPIARASEININTRIQTDDFTIISDEQRLKQVISNLVSNAIKYNHQGGMINLTLSAKDTNTLVLSIKDNGIGIPEAEQAYLFEPFKRASNSSSIQGSGLGLHLCKQLIEQMGGSIHFKSEYNQGSHFWIELPKHSESRPDRSTLDQTNTTTSDTIRSASSKEPSTDVEPPPSVTSNSDNNNATLITIEDNPNHQRLLKKVADRVSGFHLHQAESLKTARALIKKYTPDVVILDLNLPDGQGKDLLDEFKSIPYVIVLSAFISHDRIDLSDNRTELILSKPLNIKQLTDKLLEIKQQLQKHSDVLANDTALQQQA